MSLHVQIDKERIKEFCQKWKIAEFAIFGSALREDFSVASDVDVLITFLNEADWSLMDWIDMIDELQLIFGRKVDLVSKEGLRNPFRRHEILRTCEVVYAA